VTEIHRDSISWFGFVTFIDSLQCEKAESMFTTGELKVIKYIIEYTNEEIE